MATQRTKKPVVQADTLKDPYAWIEAQTNVKSSSDIEVPTRLIDQVIGQDQAVAVAEKAASQKRNLLLIGDPGTGKSMIAKAMAEMLPSVQLDDVLVYHNTADPNQPKIDVVPAGEGQRLVRTMRRLANRKRLVRKTLEWAAISCMLGLSGLAFVIEGGATLLSLMVFGILVVASIFLYTVFRQAKDGVQFAVPKLLIEYDPSCENHTQYVDATGGHAGALLGDVRHDPFQSGGLETPTHERVEIGAVHKAHKGILFIDEINVLRLDSQQALLTAMQERKYSIVGQSETSSGAMVKTTPAPCDFILVAAGNLDAVRPPDGFHTGMHPALRSRIRGYGYEVYVNATMPDSHENRLKLCRFVAQEAKRDGRNTAFDAHAIAEVILEAQRRSGQRNTLTLRLRELGGLVRTAGDVAASQGRTLVTAQDVREAKRLSRSLEQQIAEQSLLARHDHVGQRARQEAVGIALGAGLLGTGEVGEPAGLVIPISAAVTSPLSRHGGSIDFGGGLETSAESQAKSVQTLIKKVVGSTIANRDVHVQSAVPQDGVDARSCGVALVVSALSALHGVRVRRDTVLVGALGVTGKLESVRGVTQQIESAADAGYARVVVPSVNRHDIMLNPAYRTRIEVLFADDVSEVLGIVLTGKGQAALVRACAQPQMVSVRAGP